MTPDSYLNSSARLHLLLNVRFCFAKVKPTRSAWRRLIPSLLMYCGRSCIYSDGRSYMDGRTLYVDGVPISYVGCPTYKDWSLTLRFIDSLLTYDTLHNCTVTPAPADSIAADIPF